MSQLTLDFGSATKASIAQGLRQQRKRAEQEKHRTAKIAKNSRSQQQPPPQQPTNLPPTHDMQGYIMLRHGVPPEIYREAQYTVNGKQSFRIDLRRRGSYSPWDLQQPTKRPTFDLWNPPGSRKGQGGMQAIRTQYEWQEEQHYHEREDYRQMYEEEMGMIWDHELLDVADDVLQGWFKGLHSILHKHFSDAFNPRHSRSIHCWMYETVEERARITARRLTYPPLQNAILNNDSPAIRTEVHTAILQYCQDRRQLQSKGHSKRAPVP